MKLYISGPISGYPDLNAKAFNDAAKVLRANGYDVVNPIELGEPEGWSHEQFMRRDLRLLLDCDGLAMLPGAEWSKGALQERDAAFAAGLPVLPWWVWLERKHSLDAQAEAMGLA